MIPNQYDDAFFKSQLQGLINRKMVDIVRVANEKRTRCEEYKAIHNKEWDARKRRYCSQNGCDNQVIQGGVCLKHGARRTRCSQDGCDNQVQLGGVCVKHGARVMRCRQEGCGNIVVQGGVCLKHGAIVKRKRCRQEGCTNYAVQGRVCVKHGAIVKSKYNFFMYSFT
jgi:hypothetical protein